MPVRPSFHNSHDIRDTALTDGRAISGVIGFGAGRPATLAHGIPFVQIAMPLLAPGPCYEVWSSPQRVDVQCSGPVHFATAGDRLFGILPLDEGSGEGLDALAFDAYSRIFRLADETGFRHLVRVFNYIPDITVDSGGTERYRHFNAGRHRAFVSWRRPLTAAPAACALGTHDGSPAIYFLAASDEGAAIENPRQLSAYRYPPRYGPTSPSFSRAMTIGQGRERDLYISGTASIVGHESLHSGDPTAQAEETLRNIQAVLSQCADTQLPDLVRDLILKVYIRQPNDVEAVKSVLRRVSPDLAVMIVRADICRPELLVEIEGFCRLSN